MVDVIIVKYNTPELEKTTIESVLNCTKIPYHLTIHDNYVKDEDLTPLWNKLIERSDADYICLLNSDVIVEDGWLGKMVEVFEKEENIGLVGPVPTRYDWTEGRITSTENYLVENTHHVCFFCAVFKKELWKDLGKLDENFPFNKQDVAFNKVVQKNNIRTVLRKDVRVAHYKQGSWGEAKKRGKVIKMR